MSESRHLGEKVQVLNGFAFPSSAFTTEEGLPLVRIRDIASGTTEVNFRGKFDPAYLLKNGDVLIGMDGDFLVSRWTGGDALLNQRVCKVTSKSSDVDQAFLFWFLQPHIDEIHRKTPQTTVRHLSTKDVNAIPAPDFSGCQQSKIAEVLDTLDAAIRGTEAVVAKLRAMKQGLLHDLLTRGIDANGDLRPPQPEAPHLYHQTPLGWLPKEWDHTNLGNVLATIDSGWSPACVETPPVSGEWGVLKVSAVTRGVYDDQQAKTLPTALRPRPALEVKDGDVILTRANGVAELVGKTVQVRNTQPRLMLSDKLLRLVPEKQKMTNDFLALLMTSDCIVRQIEKSMSGSSGQKNISQSQIRSYECFRPTIDEQQIITSRADAFEVRVSAEEKELNKLRLQKSGLMDDLLTGRVSVTPLL